MLKSQKFVALIIIMSIFIAKGGYAACTGSSPAWTATPDYASVSSCLSQAKPGDTINVTAGSATWANRLTITKAVSLIGAGIGKTIINNSYAPSLSGATLDATKHLISIVPAIPSDNPKIRISGFTFNFGSTSYGIYYANTSTTYDCTNVRLDHLSLTASTYVFQRYGLAHGVMDNCTIIGGMDGGGNGTLWTTNGYEFGTASNFYIEDCTWSPYSSSSIVGFRQSGNGAFRFAYRYNTITMPTGVQVFPIFDLHGNQYGVQAGGFGMEIYGNKISTDGNPYTTYFANQRGGKALVYNNNVTWTTGGGISTALKEEHQDSDGSGAAINAINGQPQHISDTYYWTNRQNGLLFGPVVKASLVDSLTNLTVPTENMHFWNHDESFDGTAGVGCGTLATMQKIANCKEGVAYWVPNASIDPAASSCSSLTNWTGPNNTPSVTVEGNIGTLYRCTADNKWTTFYVPYKYPHPLRTGDTATAKASAISAPSGLRVVSN